MCVVCSGAVPHPAIYEIPLYVSLFQAASLFLLAWWFTLREKTIQIFKSIFKQKK